MQAPTSLLEILSGLPLLDVYVFAGICRLWSRQLLAGQTLTHDYHADDHAKKGEPLKTVGGGITVRAALAEMDKMTGVLKRKVAAEMHT
jgi:hypothetical protein